MTEENADEKRGKKDGKKNGKTMKKDGKRGWEADRKELWLGLNLPGHKLVTRIHPSHFPFFPAEAYGADQLGRRCQDKAPHFLI